MPDTSGQRYSTRDVVRVQARFQNVTQLNSDHLKSSQHRFMIRAVAVWASAST
jgi:hypothetical protein